MIAVRYSEYEKCGCPNCRNNDVLTMEILKECTIH